mmetsp:Transcript_28434/g.72352  ORF Transcript_28434/g.72352 Transcript_28434/m.72352 type:complete len:479 (-) Transcript_28434:53-1489(-)
MKRCAWGFALGAVAVLLLTGFGVFLGWVEVAPRLQILLGQPISGMIWPARVTRGCNMDTCFDRFRCGASPADFRLYVYPEEGILGSNTIFSIKDPAVRERERQAFHDLLAVLRASPSFTPDPAAACVLFPGFYTLSHPDTMRATTGWFLAQRLRRLGHWNGGVNHVVWEWHDNQDMEWNTDKAILVRSGWSTRHYRPGYDLSFHLDYRNPCRWDGRTNSTGAKPWQQRSYLAYWRGGRSHPLRLRMPALHNASARIISILGHQGSSYTFCETLPDAVFGLNPRGNGLHAYRTLEILAAGAIPVYIGDAHHHPFSELIHPLTYSVVLPEHALHDVPQILQALAQNHALLTRLQAAGRLVYHRYFSTREAQISLVLETLKWRIYGRTPFVEALEQELGPAYASAWGSHPRLGHQGHQGHQGTGIRGRRAEPAGIKALGQHASTLQGRRGSGMQGMSPRHRSHGTSGGMAPINGSGVRDAG